MVQLHYAFSIYSKYRRFPKQIVLYVGKARMKIPKIFRSEGCSFVYQLVDIRTIDGTDLLNSSEIEDNVLALLTRAGENWVVARAILEKIAALSGEPRDRAIQQLMILSGLRKPDVRLVEEVQRMAIEYNVWDNVFYVEAFTKGEAKGKAEGEAKGKAKGKKEGAQRQASQMLKRLLLARFGAVPNWATERIRDLSTKQMETLSTRVLQCESLEDLFG